MLDAIKKKLFSATPKEVEMSKQDNLQTALAAVEEKHTAELTVLQATLASQSAALEAVTGKFAELQAKHDEMQAVLAGAEQAKAEALAQAKAAKTKARTEAIVAAMGTDKAEAMFAATESLDDAAFQAVVGAMTVTLAKEAANPLFKEVGVSAVAEVSPDVLQETIEAQILKKKYAK